MTTTRELLAQIYQHSQVGTMEEAKDPGEYDQEGGMVKGQLKTMIDAAVSNAEYCQSTTQAMQIYNYAKARLNKITCPTGNCGSAKRGMYYV